MKAKRPTAGSNSASLTSPKAPIRNPDRLGSMIRRGLWLLLTVTLLEIVGIIYFLRLTGPAGMLAILGFMAVGAYLFSTLGRNTLARTAQFANGQAHDEHLAKDQIRLVSAVFMFMPGPISTIMGLLLLVPQLGRYARNRVLETPVGQSLVKLSNFNLGRRPGARSDAIEVDLVRHDNVQEQGSRTEITQNSGD